jgi:hypothetical protein
LPYEIPWERPFGVRKHFTGVIAPDELARDVETITIDCGFDDRRYVIINLRDALATASICRAGRRSRYRTQR